MSRRSGAQQLLFKYRTDLKLLQRSCPHIKTVWKDTHGCPRSHPLKFRICTNCEKVVEFIALCWGCKKRLTIKQFKEHMQYCPACRKEKKNKE